MVQRELVTTMKRLTSLSLFITWQVGLLVNQPVESADNPKT